VSPLAHAAIGGLVIFVADRILLAWQVWRRVKLRTPPAPTLARYRAILEAYRPPWATPADFVEATLFACRAPQPPTKAIEALEAQLAAAPPGEAGSRLTLEELLERLYEVEKARARGTACTCQRETCPLHARSKP
jgi:hypothetical protein